MSKYPTVITLTGKAGAGKDTISNLIRDWCNENDKKCFCLAYADQLKNMVARNFSYSESDKESYRHYLQEFGDLVRGIEKDYFVHHVWHTVDLLRHNYDVFIITDARYENELSPFPYRMMYPIVNVYIQRDFESSLGELEQTHSSEQMATNPDWGKFHAVINNNGTLDESKSQVDEMMKMLFNPFSYKGDDNDGE